MSDIRRLEEEAALYLSKVMSNNKTTTSNNIPESDSSSDIFFDCYDNSPVASQKPSLIRYVFTSFYI